MRWFLKSIIFLYCFIESSKCSLPLLTKLIYGQFPQDFKWGIASSNYQMEGGVYQDGKGESIWDRFAHDHPQLIQNQDNADIADNSYNLWQEDIEQLKLMGLKYFRISIAWPRILYNGTLAGGINKKGLQHYRTVFEALIEAGITPIVTICHYDYPQALQDLGGWMNPEIINWYTDYARICFENYGDIIKHWLTFNSPALTSNLVQETILVDQNLTPQETVECFGSCTYRIVHNILLSHAKGFQLYNKEFRDSQKGIVGIIADSEWYGPGTDRPEDIAAGNRAIQFELGWVLNPVINGDYPDVMKEYVGKKGLRNGKSRLPVFTSEQSKSLKGSYDFVGLNTYTAFQTYALPEEGDVIGAMADGFAPKNQTSSAYRNLLGAVANVTFSLADKEVKANFSKEWPLSGDGFRHFNPVGLRKLLQWIKREYGNPPVMITENGWADTNGSTNDPWRVQFFEQSINNVLQASILDGCNVIGYMAWAFLDAFEWQGGYSAKFGLIRVDQKDPKRRRFPKLSSRYFAQLARDNGFLRPKPAYESFLQSRLTEALGIDPK